MLKEHRCDDDGSSLHLLPMEEKENGHNNHSALRTTSSVVALIVVSFITMYLFVIVTAPTLLRDIALDAAHATALTVTVPEYFQTKPQIYAGPTATAQHAPFLAQYNPAPFGNPASFVPNAPLETAIPIAGNINNTSIFRLLGQLSSYFPSPGFGSKEYSLPPGANLSQVHVLHRHGSRYPTSDSAVPSFGSKLENLTKSAVAQWTGPLNFINDWRYTLGSEILVARGRQELFDSGVLHYYNYGQLYNTSTKLIARTTTQDRMLKSAEYFMAGFFGLEWTENVTLEVQIEHQDFNTSLAGYFQCPNNDDGHLNGGTNASRIWENIYLESATQRLRAFSGSYNWTNADSYNAQTLCAYETVAYGYSQWCELFTYQEWKGFEYSIDLQFHGNAGFGSPSARGVGIGYVQEIYARLQNHLYELSPGATNVNYTLATMNATFPLNQSLYFDFSHDTNIFSILTAFGLRQFAEQLPATEMPENRSVIISHITPFATRVDLEIIRAPQPVRAARPTNRDAPRADYYDIGSPTAYAHLLINQRTVPLYQSYPECGYRVDGWCDMNTFLHQLNSTLETARYEYSCFGNYTGVPYGDITDGVPISKRATDLDFALGGTGSQL